jgi:hypothetical protein
VIVYGIEGASFATGEALSPAVHAATERVAELVRDEVAQRTSTR